MPILLRMREIIERARVLLHVRVVLADVLIFYHSHPSRRCSLWKVNESTR